MKFEYGDKFKAIGKTEAMDVVALLKDFLPDSAFGASTSNGASEDSNSESWTPPGKMVKSYARDGQTYEVWCSTLTDFRVREMLRNMRILVPLFIEGGTACNYLDDPDWSLSRWKIWLLYQKSNDLYDLAGFSTSYRLWVFPSRSNRVALGETDIPTPPPSEPDFIEDFDAHIERDMTKLNPRQTTPPPSYPNPAPEDSEALYLGDYSPLDESPSRERISQFIILPPFQRGGHGAALYDTMIEIFRADKSVFEITVEDPNEAFDELRDYSDLAYLRTLPQFKDLRMADYVADGALDPDKYVPIEQLVDQEILTTLRYQSKISPRQFSRLVEMQLLSSIPVTHRSTARLVRKEKSANTHDRQFFFWRLFTKHRIYLKNADQLIQVDEEERGPMVANAVEAQMQEYQERLDVFEKRQRRYAHSAPKAANGAASSRKGKGKRVVEDDEDDDPDETSSKKMRLSD